MKAGQNVAPCRNRDMGDTLLFLFPKLDLTLADRGDLVKIIFSRVWLV